jgi:hypothetical protein
MSQSSLDDDELFGEAVSEMRADVEESLERAREELPDADAVWEVDAENTLGVLNALKNSLDAGEAEEHLRGAKKAFLVGDRADAFDDADDLREELETLEGVVADIATAGEQVSELAATVPGLRSALEELEEENDD